MDAGTGWAVLAGGVIVGLVLGLSRDVILGALVVAWQWTTKMITYALVLGGCGLALWVLFAHVLPAMTEPR